MAANFGLLGRWRPGLLLDVTLPDLLARWAKGRRFGAAGRDETHGPQPGGVGRPHPAQVMTLKRLRRKVARLAAGYRPAGQWARYEETCQLQPAGRQAKLAAVERFLRNTRPARVLDLGCNTGHYSRLAAGLGAQVIAADADHDAVEVLYRQLRRQPAPIWPMVVDLCNPSPAVGLMNRERAAWAERVESDCVLALALLHHLLVAGNLPLAAACDLLAGLTRRDLVLEFIPHERPALQRLLEFAWTCWPV